MNIIGRVTKDAQVRTNLFLFLFVYFFGTSGMLPVAIYAQTDGVYQTYKTISIFFYGFPYYRK